jgi:hypothetical protein
MHVVNIAVFIYLSFVLVARVICSRYISHDTSGRHTSIFYVIPIISISTKSVLH